MNENLFAVNDGHWGCKQLSRELLQFFLWMDCLFLHLQQQHGKWIGARKAIQRLTAGGQGSHRKTPQSLECRSQGSKTSRFLSFRGWLLSLRFVLWDSKTSFQQQDEESSGARQSEGLERRGGVHSHTQSLRPPELQVFIKTQKQWVIRAGDWVPSTDSDQLRVRRWRTLHFLETLWQHYFSGIIWVPESEQHRVQILALWFVKS